MTSPREDPMPLGEGDRDTAVQRVQEAYAEGLISHEQLEERLHGALTATTHSDLVPVLTALAAKEGVDSASAIAAASGRITRRGAWHVPRFLTVRSAYGKVRLDLSRAVIEHPEVDIELHLGSGRARIIVPRDAIVDLDDLETKWKDTRYRPLPPSRPGGPRIRIHGTMEFGRLKVRHARR
ncbi:DUF1707 domain-containing protein [Streptomyces sp. NPDC052040]|uniref:DUF1707 SHOCT-like domain-containing protein n=1 Tax=unclassified Streptomyces TaxID=2593676 RepID=UPI0037CDB135